MSIFICPGCGRSCGKGIILQCTKCVEIFHPQCAGISPTERKEKPNWICLMCSNNDEVHESWISNNNPCMSPIIKQFVVANCSKERPGSTVTKTINMEF